MDDKSKYAIIVKSDDNTNQTIIEAVDMDSPKKEVLERKILEKSTVERIRYYYNKFQDKYPTEKVIETHTENLNELMNRGI